MAQDVFPETDPPYLADVLEALVDTFELLYMRTVVVTTSALSRSGWSGCAHGGRRSRR